MLSVYYLVNDHLEKAEPGVLNNAAVWIDLFEPTHEETASVEMLLRIAVPTRQEMQEIEESSQLYVEDDALFVTAPVLYNAESDHPENTAITFILTRSCTVTVRYATPQPFTTFAHRATRQRGMATTADGVLVGLLEAITDRLADVLEKVGNDLDSVSRQIFRNRSQTLSGKRRETKAEVDYQEILRSIGRDGDLASKARDSLMGVMRIVAFLGQAGVYMTRKDVRARIKTVSRDARSLSEHSGFVSGKINFLLDATLGMINIQQNNIIKLFSVMAVIFLPPTLVASIYGMNFKYMPELDWSYGYPFALFLMVLAGVLPYVFFKRKGWF